LDAVRSSPQIGRYDFITGVLRFVVWLLCTVTLTISPLNFGTVPPGEAGREIFLYGRGQQDLPDFVLNMLLYAPLGAVLWRHWQHYLTRPITAETVAGVAGAVISATLEYLQAFLPTRDSSLIDVVANTAGALVGALAYRRWRATIWAAIARWRGSPVLMARLLIGFTLTALALSGTLQTRTSLGNWSPEYPLLVGNERTGDRPWRGRVFSLELTDAATTPALARRFSEEGWWPGSGTPLAAFVFSGSPPYRDATGNVTSLDWSAPLHGSSHQAGVDLPGRPWLQTAGPAVHLARRFRETDAFTLRVRCATADVHQQGPARIMSNSWDPGLRNLTLGQQNRDLVLRLRTPATGPNGANPELVVPDVFVDEQPRDILVSYDGARLLVAVSRSHRVFRTEFTPGTALALATLVDFPRSELQISKLSYLVLLFSIPAGVVALLGSTPCWRLVCGPGWILLFTVLYELTLVVVSGRRFDPANVGLTALVGLVVFIIVEIIVSPGDFRALLRGRNRESSAMGSCHARGPL
jgi:hypothetical protein